MPPSPVIEPPIPSSRHRGAGGAWQRARESPEVEGAPLARATARHVAVFQETNSTQTALVIKFIHTADWHLGMQAHFLPGDARVRFAEARFDAVRRIAELARDERCAFVVSSGDVFDSNHVDRQAVAKAIDALSAFTVPVFLLPGNHDPLDPSSIYRTSAWLDHAPAKAVVPEEIGAIPVAGVAGAEVIAAPWHTKHHLGDPVCACYGVPSGSDGALRIVLGHGVVDELSPNADDPSLIRASAMRQAIQDGTAHYIALGDRHSVTEIEGTDGRAFYAGTPVSTDYGELKPNHVLLVTVDGRDCTVERRAIGTWVFERLTRDLTGEADVDGLAQSLEAVPSKHTTAVKLALRGALNLATTAKLEELLGRNRLTFAALNIWERQADLVVAPDDSDLDGLQVSGYVREALGQLREEAAGAGEEAAVARDALSLLYRLAR